MRKAVLILAVLLCAVPVFAFNSIVSVNAGDVAEYRTSSAGLSPDGISYGVDMYVRIWQFRLGTTVLRQFHPDRLVHGRFAIGFAFDIANSIRFMPSLEIPWFVRGGRFMFSEHESIPDQLANDTLGVRLDIEVPVNYMTFGLYAGLDTGLSVKGDKGGENRTMTDNFILGVKVGVTLY